MISSRKVTVGIVAIIMVLAPVVALANHGAITALYSSSITFTNTGSAVNEVGVPFPQSASRLIDGGFIEADALNSGVQAGSTDIKAMPGSSRLAMLHTVASSTAAFTTETTAANNQTANDMTLVDSTASIVGESYFYGADTAFRQLTVNVGTAGAGGYSLAWQYYSSAASAWIGLAGVVDNSDSFRVAGTSTIAWSMPYDMATTTVNGLVAYWVRSRIATTTTMTIAPIGTRAYWETAQWWAYADTIPSSGSKNYTLYTGGSTDLSSSHALFVGPNTGVLTSDTSTLEVADNSWEISLSGYFKTTTTTSDGVNIRRIFRKAGEFDMYVSGADKITATITGTTTTASVFLYDVPQGQHTIALSYKTGEGDIRFYLDGVQSTSTASGLTLANSASPWEWGIYDAVLYFDYIKVRRVLPNEFVLTPDSSTGKDTHVRELAPTTNYEGGQLFAYYPATGQQQTTLISFDVSQFGITPSAITVSTSTLRMLSDRIYSPGTGPDVDIEVQMLSSGTWDASTVTWNTAPGVTGSVLDTQAVSYPDAYYYYDVTDAVKAWVNGTTTNNGLRFSQPSIEVTQGQRKFDASEAAFASQRPQLTITLSTSLGPFTGAFSDSYNVLSYQLRLPPSPTIQDESGIGNDGTMTWPTQPTGIGNTSTATTLTVTVGALTSTQSPSNISAGIPVPVIATGINSQGGLYNTGTGSTIPIVGPVLEPFFTASNIPFRAFAILFAMSTTIGAGAIVGVWMKTLKGALLTWGVCLVFWSFVGSVIPLWIVILVYVPVAALTWLAVDKVSE